MISFHRSVACQKWRGADHAVLARGRGNPHQLRPEDLRQIHQGAGLPPPPPAPRGHGGLQPGALRPARVTGADPGGLQGHPEVWSENR